MIYHIKLNDNIHHSESDLGFRFILDTFIKSDWKTSKLFLAAFFIFIFIIQICKKSSLKHEPN